MPIDGVNLEFHPLRYRLALTACLVPFGLMTPLLEIGPTHVFNPDWPAHARLHEVWQLVTHGGLAALCLWLAWARGQVRLATGIAAVVVGGFLVALALAPTYGGGMKHSDGTELAVAGVNVAVAVMAAAMAGLALIAWATRKDGRAAA